MKRFLHLVLTLCICSNLFAEEPIIGKFPTSVISSLYENDSLIDIHGMCAWQNLVYVAQSKNQVHQLDVWNCSNLKNPIKTDSYDFGTPNGSRLPFIPLAIMPFDSVLLVQANRSIYTFNHSLEGKIDFIRKNYMKVSTNEATQIQFSGKYGSMFQQDKQDLKYKNYLISFINPEDPFWVAHDRTVDGKITSSIHGEPVLFENGMNGAPAYFKTYKSVGNMNTHIDDFWGDKINGTLSPSTINMNTFDAIDAIVSSIDREQILTEALNLYLNETNIQNLNIEEWLLENYDANTDLSLILNEYKINMDDSFSEMIRKLVKLGLSESLNQNISKLVYSQSLEKYISELYGFVDLNDKVEDIYTKAFTIFSADYVSTEQEVMRYATDKIIGPMIGNPGFMKWTTDEMIENMENTEVANVIDLGLGAADFALTPAKMLSDLIFEFLLGSVDIDEPSCADWPENTRKLMEMALYKNTSGIEPDNLAWFEMVKFICYLNNVEYSSYIGQIDERIQSFLDVASQSYTDRFMVPFNLIGNKQQTLKKAIEDYAVIIPAETFIEDALVSAFSSRFYSIGISPNQTVREVLRAINYPMVFDIDEVNYVPDGTLLDLIEILSNQQVVNANYIAQPASNYSLKSSTTNTLLSTKFDQYFEFASTLSNQSESKIKDVLLEYTSSVFGTSELNMPIANLMENSIATQFDLGNVVAEQIHTIFAELFARAIEGDGYTDVLNNIEDAIYEGDCVKQWRLFLKAVRAVAYADPSGYSFTTANAMDLALHEAYMLGIDHFITQMTGMIASQVEYGWKSWPVNMSSKTIEINPILPESEHGTLFDSKIFEDNIYNIYYKRTEDFTNRKILTLLTQENILSDNPINRTIDLGIWNTIDYFYTEKEYVWISGEVFVPGDDGFPDGCAIIMNMKTDEPVIQYVRESGYKASLLTAAQGFQLAFNDQYFVIEGVDQVLFLPNTFNIQLVESSNTSSLKSFNNKIKVYPNPANQQIKIKGVNKNTEVKIYNTTGQLVSSSSGENVNIEQLSNGIYTLRINNFYKKITIKH